MKSLLKIKNLFLLLFILTFIFLTACADPYRQHIKRPIIAESPTPATIFGEATLLNENKGLDLKQPIEVPALPLSPKGVLSLNKTVETAIKVSPGIDSADQAYVGAMWGRWEAITNYLPQVQAGYNLTRLDEPSRNILGFPVGSRNSSKATVSVTQPLFTGYYNTANYLVSQIGVRMADIQRIQAKQDLILNVKAAYYNILLNQKALEVAKKTVTNLESHLNVAQSFYDVGMIPHNQVLEAEVNLASAVQRKNALEHDLVSAKSHLNILLRQNSSNPLVLEDILKYRKFPLSMVKCIEMSLIERPEVKLARKQVEVNTQAINMARAEYYPQISAFHNTTKEDYGTNAFSGNSAWNIGIMASINLWDWGKTKSKVERSKIDLNRAINSLTELEDLTEDDVITNYQRLVSAGKNISVSEKAIVSAAENLRMVSERYAEQVATNTEVLDAQTRYSEAQYDYYQSLYNYNIAWISLERSLGSEVL